MQARKRARAVASASAADSEVVDAQRGLTHAYRNALAFFAACSDTIVELQIVTHHAHASEHVGAVADERGTFQRRPELAVLDCVGFARGEHELAGGDVDL